MAKSKIKFTDIEALREAPDDTLDFKDFKKGILNKAYRFILNSLTDEFLKKVCVVFGIYLFYIMALYFTGTSSQEILEDFKKLFLFIAGLLGGKFVKNKP